MAPFKWSLIVLLSGLLLLGLPNGVKSETPAEETKTSSVKECKVHIEKALEQYWEQEKPEKSSNPLDQTEHVSSQSAEEKPDDDDKTPEESQIQNQNQSDDTDEDGDEDDQDNNINGSETENGGEDIDDDENEDDDGEDTDDDENEDDDTENESQTNENTNLEEEMQDIAKDKSTIQETEDDVEDEDDTEEINDVEASDDKILTNQEETETVTSEVEGEEEDEDDEDEDDVSEQKVDQDTLEEEGEEEDEEESTIEETESTTEKKVEDGKQTESEKVTGEADSASAGVVSELPQEKPSTEQPQTPEVPEETIPVATVAQKLNETIDDVEEDKLPESVPEDKDDDTIENIYEEDDDEDESSSTLTFRSRDHIDVILSLDEIGTEYEKEEEKLAQSIFKEIKKIQLTNIRPMEMLYKYTDSTTRVLGDAEIFNKPMLLFIGPWNSGKTTIINYLLGNERTPAALKTGTGITDVDFTLVTYGDQKQVISGTELAADWRYAGVQKFGQGFLDHFRSIQVPSTLLKKVTIVDTPGILENKKNTERSYSLNDAFQWFIDRADAIYVVLDPTKVDIGNELGSVLDQLKGRDVRFILNKADTIRRSDLMRVVGQLFWNLSPLMSSTEAPMIYAVSLTTKPYNPSAPARFLADQESNFLYDMKDTLDKRIENRILYARRHAVRVRNHAKMVDCYLATYYRHKSIFSNKKNVAKLITENPRDYNIFDGIGSMTNISRYDLPDPTAYKQFFKLHPLYDFKPLASTCSYFRGCPMDKLDEAIARDIPELFAKYKKAKSSSNAVKQEGR